MHQAKVRANAPAAPSIGKNLPGASTLRCASPAILMINFDFTSFITSVQNMHQYAENIFHPLLAEMILLTGVIVLL